MSTLAATARDLFVDGDWHPSTSGARMPVFDPATEEVIAEVADAGIEDAMPAIRSAGIAQAAWAQTPARE